MPDLDALELRYLEWRVEYGEELPAGAVPHPWRRQSLNIMHGKLNISMNEGAPSLTWYGSPAQEDIQQTKALAVRLLREHAAQPWPGSMEPRAFENLTPERKKRLCIWNLLALFAEPGGRDTVREIRMQGTDTGDNSARLAFEKPLAAHLQAQVRHLHANAPKALHTLLYSSKGEGGALYSLSVEGDGQVNLSRRRSEQDKDSSGVAPAVAAQVADIVRKHGADGWNGFAPADWSYTTPGSFELSLHYNTGQQVWARGRRVTFGRDRVYSCPRRRSCRRAAGWRRGCRRRSAPGIAR